MGTVCVIGRQLFGIIIIKSVARAIQQRQNIIAVEEYRPAHLDLAQMPGTNPIAEGAGRPAEDLYQVPNCQQLREVLGALLSGLVGRDRRSSSLRSNPLEGARKTFPGTEDAVRRSASLAKIR